MEENIVRHAQSYILHLCMHKIAHPGPQNQKKGTPFFVLYIGVPYIVALHSGFYEGGRIMYRHGDQSQKMCQQKLLNMTKLVL